MSRYRTIIRLLAVLAAVALGRGCGNGDSPSAPPTPDPARPTTVTVSPATAQLMVLGATVQLTAEVRDQNGHAIAGATVTWQSSATAVATVSASGLVTATGNGTATVTATSGGVSATAAVTVAQEVSAVAVSPAADTLVAGATRRLAAEATDANGHAVAGAEFAWASSDTLVAVVDDEGLVTAVGEGTAEIVATAGLASGTATVTVTVTVGGSAAIDRAALAVLYEATDGPNWVDNTNWLSDAPLGEWYGVGTDASGMVVRLELDDNALSGPIPREIGSLRNLKRLDLPDNGLTGLIPVDLGNLTNLTNLELDDNGLTGPIPPELGNLTKLTRLELDDNDLTGPIPFSFLQIDGLDEFDITGNESLCVPGTRAFTVWLDRIKYPDNTEPISCNADDVFELTLLFELAGGSNWTRSDGWLGDFVVEEWHGVRADSLGRVLALDLSDNELSGWLPSTLGQLSEMITFRIEGNPGLSGRLPDSLTDLSLRTLHYRGTELCAPADSGFGAWLMRIPSHEGTGVECPPLSDHEIVEAVEAAKRCMLERSRQLFGSVPREVNMNQP